MSKTTNQKTPQTQDERRRSLILALLAERRDGDEISVPADAEGQRRLLRALMNVRPPMPAPEGFMEVQDAYLQERLRERGITRLEDLSPIPLDERLFLWRGDITTLAVDAIVNAANSQMLGCFVPGHACIDNAIHSFAGIGLRLGCAELMGGGVEPTGSARITGAYNLPSRHVIHTVGPIVQGEGPTPRDEGLLRSCYRTCLELADQAGLTSIAFCCISSGLFRYPRRDAAAVATSEVRRYLAETGSAIRVVFDVFSAEDEAIYRDALGIDS